MTRARSPSGPIFDWQRLRAQVLLPLGHDQPGRYQRYDWDHDRLAGWHTVPIGGVVIVEGVYSTRNELAAWYAAHDLAGPGVWGPPRDVDAALTVLREAVALGINHIDTSDYYGPHSTNQLIRRALSPYPEDLVIVTKIGGRRGDGGSWLPDFSPEGLTAAVHDNLRNLGQDTLHVVNLRMDGPGRAVEEPLATLVDLQRQGLVRHIGLSNVTREQIWRGAALADIVCVQNLYNLVHRDDDALIDELAGKGIAYTPFFPLGGFGLLQSSVLSEAAATLNATPLQVALAWLLQRSPNILLIPGTSSVTHLHENVKAATLPLPEDVLTALQAIGARLE